MSDYKIYYIHGFGSSVNSETLKMLQEEFPDATGLTYDYNNPVESVRALAREINANCFAFDTYPIIVGSSLGGWYAEQLTNVVIGDFIMYNPSMRPDITLARHGLPKEVLSKYIDASPYKFLPTSRSVLLSIDDEIIDYTQASIKYKSIADVMFTTGGHRMTEKNMKHIVAKIKYLQNQIT